MTPVPRLLDPGVLGEARAGLSAGARHRGRARRAAQRAARVPQPRRGLARALPVLVVLVVEDHFAEHQEVFRGPTSLWRRRWLKMKIVMHNL